MIVNDQVQKTSPDKAECVKRKSPIRDPTLKAKLEAEMYDPERVKKTSAPFFTSMNLINMIIGSGVIALANAFCQSGILVGLLLLIVSAVMADYSIIAIAKAGGLSNRYTYQGVMKFAFGKKGQLAITACQVLYPFFGMISYFIAIYWNMVGIVRFFVPVGDHFYTDGRFLLFLVMLCVVAPLSMFREIAALEKASSVSIAAVLFYVFVIIYKSAFMPSLVFYFENSFPLSAFNAIQAVSIISFALSCHHNILPLFRSMDRIRVSTFSTITHVSLTFTLGTYVPVALAGLFSFFGYPDGNLLNDYCNDDMLVFLARIMFTLTVALTSPLQILSCREAIVNLAFNRVNYNSFYHVLVTGSIMGACYLVATFVKSIESVISLSGSLIAAPLIYIFPGMILIKTMKRGWWPTNFTKAGCLLLIVFGVVIAVVGTTVSVVSFTQKINPVSKVKYWCLDRVNVAVNNTIGEVYSEETPLNQAFFNAFEQFTEAYIDGTNWL